MTVQLTKSIATPEFLARIEAFRQAKLEHQKTTDVSAPVEHGLIEACIKRVSRGDQPDDFVADYAIVEPSFDEHKAQLVQQVSEAEMAAFAAIVPHGKRRLQAMRANDIVQTDAVRANDALIKRVAIGEKAPADRTAAETQFLAATENMGAFVAAGRSAEDAQFMADEATRRARSDKINRHAAELHAEIEDLTAETIDVWQMKPFPA